MKKINNPRIYFTITILFIFLITAGCLATKQDVREAVDESNKAIASTIAFNTVALIPDSELTLQPNENNTTWQKSIEQMDLIIASNPDQGILINHLRVRQAMLLTIYRQDNFAREKWKLVEVDKLVTERDRKLQENSEVLVWWYKRSANPQNLSVNFEIPKALDFIQNMDASINSTQNHDMKIYLAAIRAQLALRVLRGTPTGNKTELIDKQNQLVKDLEQFVNAYDQQEIDWLRNNPNFESGDSIPVYELRNIFWLSSIINRYMNYDKCIQERPYNIPKAVWSPEWLNNINVDAKCL